jgi:hypothetical protein
MTTNRIFAIDPGSTQSGWLLFEAGKVLDCGVADNHDMLPWIRAGQGAAVLAIEMAESFGQKVWSQVFTTVRWTGRFQQAWRDPDAVRMVTRSQIKLHVVGKRAANDQMIRQALIDTLGAPGTKAKPGPTYGVSSHAWAALAVAVTVAGLHKPTPLEIAAKGRQELAEFGMEAA